LVALISGFIVVFGLLGAKKLDGWTALYLASSVATSATGFGFPFDHFLPSHWIGVISLVLLAVAILARYVLHLAGAWRWIYVVSVVTSVFFLVFVTIAQAFQKVDALKALAPTQSEPPFAIAEVVALLVFVVLAFAAVKKFRADAAR
jgi:magnesium-transporting ATPase (P-type)